MRLLVGVLLAAFAGGGFPFYQKGVKAIPKDIPPFIALGIIFFVAAVLMLVAHFVVPGQGGSLSWAVLKSAAMPLLMTAVIFAAANVAIKLSFQFGTPQAVFTTVYLPVFMATGAVFIGLYLAHERLSTLGYVGVATALAGSLVGVVGYLLR